MSPFAAATPPAIQAELDAGERVLWAAQPDPTHLARRALLSALSGVAGFCFMLFWLWGASAALRTQMGAHKTPDLFSIVFPAFGLLGLGFTFMLMLAPLFELQRAPRIFYALTDKRALIVTQGARSKVRVVMPSEFSLERREKSTGRGDLILKREISGMRGRDRSTEEIGFFGIDNAREVERLARQIKP